MVIKSNTLGKLQKIRNGNVFDSPLIFVRELLQNAQRSKAKKVVFYVDGDMLYCEDDGCGCGNPENVFTLDLSDWESTNEGYGIGFWACLAIPDIRSITVMSKSWRCDVDAVKLFDTGDLTVSQQKAENRKGFRVEFRSDWFNDHVEDIEKYMYDIAKYLPMDIIMNEFKVPHYTIFDTFTPSTFHKTYDNRFFKAKFAVSDEYFEQSKMYYESRFVKDECFRYVSGVIEVKGGKLTLKEPDRTSYTKDDKYYAFAEKVEECIKDLYKSYIQVFGLDDDSYSSAILHWLDLKDYEKMLDFDDNMVQKAKTIATRHLDGGEKKETEAVVKEAVNADAFKKQPQRTVQTFHSAAKTETSVEAAPIVRTTVPVKSGFKDKIKRMKKAVWVRKSEYSVYSDEIQEAKYKGLDVIIAKNDLYAAALGQYNIVHLSELNDHFSECYIKENIELKNGKEKAFMALIQPICKKYNLPDDTFLICDLSVESRFVVGGQVVQKRQIKNKRGQIQIYGVADGRHVYLDRNALGLNRFTLRANNSVVGVHELKALLANVNTLAHELSHLCKGTKDNTPEHYQAEIAFQKGIIELYV